MTTVVSQAQRVRRTWLVTGGCGFIGSHLVDALVAAGDDVRVLDDLSSGRLVNLSPRARFFRADVSDPRAVDEALDGVGGCFHLAAIASVERGNRDWVGTHRVNLTGTITVFDAARRHGTPVVYASSAAVYGAADDPPFDERRGARPISAYGADKLGCELHAHVARVVHGVRSVGLRFFNVYGPRQDASSPYSGAISAFCKRVLSREPITIYGDGGQTRDFVYVSDVVEALMLAMAILPDRVPAMNVCTGRSESVLDVARLISEIAGVPLEAHHGPPRSGDVRVSLGDPALAREYLGFEARTSLRDGLRATYFQEAKPVAAADPVRPTTGRPAHAKA